MTEKFTLPGFETGGANIRAPHMSCRNLLEETRLAQLSQRSACANCGGSLDTKNEYQMKIRLCRSCLRSYASVGAILERHTEQKIRHIYQGGKS